MGAADFFMENTSLSLFHQEIDRLVQFRKRFGVPFLDGVDDAMVHMVAQNYFADVVDRAAHGGKLYEHLGAVASVVDHALNGVQMSDHARQTVLYGFGVLVRMRVGVRMHRSVGMDVNVLLRGMHGFRMFHNFSLALRHVLRGNS